MIFETTMVTKNEGKEIEELWIWTNIETAKSPIIKFKIKNSGLKLITSQIDGIQKKYKLDEFKKLRVFLVNYNTINHIDY